MGQLDGELVVITGAAGGIGSAVAKLAVARGARVVGVDIHAEGPVISGGFDYRRLDITDESAVTRFFADLVNSHGRVSGIVNTAAVYCSAPFRETTLSDLRSLFEVNVIGTYLMCRGAVPQMQDLGHGSIVNFASIAFEHATAENSLYATTKGAIVSLTKGIAQSVAKQSIRANVVSPGPVTTPMRADAKLDPEYQRRMVDSVPLGRAGSPMDVAGAVAFLLSSDSTWLTGEVLRIDGGLASKR